MTRERVKASGRKHPPGGGEFLLVFIMVLIVAAVGFTYWLEFAPEAPPEPAAAQTTVRTTQVSPEPKAVTTSGTVQTVPETTVSAAPVTARACEILETMELDEKICQLFIVTHDQLTGVSAVNKSGPTTKAAIEKYPVGGVIYFSPNLVSRDQCIRMIRDLQSYSRLGLFISVDEEGGTVTRLAQNSQMGTTKFSSMGVIGKDEDTDAAYNVGYTIGTEIAELGFNLDFAPVADVNSNPRNPVIGKRAFHTDPCIAADLVAACVEGFTDSGTLCTLKHFPGHGDTLADSHYGAVTIDKTLEELMACELVPFRAGIEAGAPVVMVGHITVPELSKEDVPATFSVEIVTELLRETLGFDGVIITDSMQMGAVTNRYASGEAAVKALQAGVDIILMPSRLSDAVSGIREAVESGELTEGRIDESVLRILELKLRSGIILMN